MPSPGLEMNALQLAYGDASYPSYPTSSTQAPHRPLTPPDGMALPTGHLSTYQLVSGGAPDMSPGQSSRDSGTQSPPPSLHEEESSPRARHRYNPITPAASRPAARRRRRIAEEEDDEDDEEFKPGHFDSSAGEE